MMTAGSIPFIQKKLFDNENIMYITRVELYTKITLFGMQLKMQEKKQKIGIISTANAEYY